MSQESVNFKIHVVGVSGSSSEPRPITAPLDATLQDVVDTLVQEKVVPQAPTGQEYRFKVGNVYADSGSTVREAGVRQGDALKLVLEQQFA